MGILQQLGVRHGPWHSKSMGERPTLKAVYSDTQMWEACEHLTNVTIARPMLTSHGLRTTYISVKHHQNPFQLSNNSLFLESCIACPTVNLIVDSINTSNLMSLDLSALPDLGRYKDRVPDNLNQPGYPGWNPERRQIAPNVPETNERCLPVAAVRGVIPELWGQCATLWFLSFRKTRYFSRELMVWMISLFRNSLLFFFAR